MHIRKKFLYLIFAFIIALGSALAWISSKDKTPISTPPAIQLQNLSGTIIQQKQTEQLLSLTPIKAISVNKNNLIIGDDSLLFKTDTIQSSIVYLPVKPEVWKNYWSALLGESTQTDSSKRWSIALMKLRIALFAEWEILSRQNSWAKLSDEQKLTYTIVGTIQNNPNLSFFIEGKNLRKSGKHNSNIVDDNGLVVINEYQKSESSRPLIYWLLSGALLLTGIAGILFTKKIPTTTTLIQEKKHDQRPEITTAELNTPEVKEHHTATGDDQDLFKKYIENFYKRYGDFYTNIELLTEYPTDELTKQKIKQRLVEMGLHAHSFARAYLFNYLDRPQKEPNTILIYEQKEVKDLDAKLYKILSLDGQETNKRYRYLAKIIAEMTINSLEGVLLSDTYVPSETFEHLK